MKSETLLHSIRFALAGVAHTLRTQRNFKIHLALAALALALAVWLGLPRGESAALLLAIGLVLQAELLNTAVEAAVDKASPEIHPLAGIAKDCAAGAVLVSALIAIAVGLLVLGPPLLARLTR